MPGPSEARQWGSPDTSPGWWVRDRLGRLAAWADLGLAGAMSALCQALARRPNLLKGLLNGLRRHVDIFVLPHLDDAPTT